MNTQRPTTHLSLTPTDNQRLANLCGQFDEHIHCLEQALNVQIYCRGHDFQIIGPKRPSETASKILQTLYSQTEHSATLSLADIQQQLQHFKTTLNGHSSKAPSQDIQIKTKHKHIKARSDNQRRYLSYINQYDLNFAIGPAGTGKTYLAVASAVAALEQDRVQRLVLARPAVEAGERLGFLPGDLAQKVDPYLRPLYDALYDMIGVERVNKLIAKQVIEVAPLAYMRGRTLNDAFIILDESQNTTIAQMKMFLTRIGFHSTAVVTGDITQIDLAKGIPSGLCHALDILKNVKDIGFTFFDSHDVARHPLVQKVINAYESHQH